MQTRLPKTDLVLLGAGHTNAHLIRMWRMKPLPRTRLTCVSDFPIATYSGMLPGALAGQYEADQMQIDLVRLCAAANVRLVVDQVVGLDCAQQQLVFDSRPPIPFDALSIGIGSRPATGPDLAGIALAIKPMQTFLARLERRLHQLEQQAIGRAIRIVVVGAGAAGFEIACCLQRRLQRRHDKFQHQISILDGGSEILKGFSPRAQLLARRLLEQRRIDVRFGSRVEQIDQTGQAVLESGATCPADLVIWATSACPAPVLDRFDLPRDEDGFLLTRDTLQSTGSDAIFVVGDAGSISNHPRPKSGVFAVRQGRILWKNMQRVVHGAAPQSWRPQTEFLRLLNTADDRAILSYRGAGLHAHWCWRLKDWIDRRFMAKYLDYQPMKMEAGAAQEVSPPTAFCGGCGSKLPAKSLARVLSQLDNPPADHVVVGLEAADDVAILSSADERQTAVTTDFFTSFLDDPWLLGKVAALNALSDLYAKQIQPRAALAMAAVPHGPVKQQELYLSQVLHGALEVLRPAGAPIVGGHTIESDAAMIGFTVLGAVPPGNEVALGRLHVGDCLVLTKPLGTGVLLAGHMRALCRAEWMETLLQTMLVSNQSAAAAAARLGVRVMTDVTGFGLAGHLLNLLEASRASAALDLADLPLLPGAAELMGRQVESTLAPGNRHAERAIRADSRQRQAPQYAALFDPQTSGGLLLAVPAPKWGEARELLGEQAHLIGEVVEDDADAPCIILRSRPAAVDASAVDDAPLRH